MEEATSISAGFHAGPLFWLNWNLEVLVKFQDKGSFARKGRRPGPTTNSTEIYN